MAAPPPTFTWILWPSHGELSGASDEFVIEGFRVRLRGNSLDLVVEGYGACSPDDAARALAERYCEALRRRLPRVSMLITMEQFLVLTTPPLGGIMTMVSPSREDRSRVARAVREVRNELLADADLTLRRCYDYLQDAHEENRLGGKPAYIVYEAMEVLEERFGSSEAETSKALGRIFKKTKKTANEARHLRRKGQAGSNTSGQAVEFARETIRAYERYLLNPSS